MQMLERSHFLLPYYNDTASVQDWCSTDNGSQTPLQDDGTSTSTETRQLSTLVVNTETCAKLSDTIAKVEESSTSHDEWTMTGEREKKRSKQCATSNRVNIDFSDFGDELNEPTTAR